jgi:hypothetical protein
MILIAPHPKTPEMDEKEECCHVVDHPLSQLHRTNRTERLRAERF